MKLHRPLFSLIIIAIQLCLSLKSFYDYVQWGKINPELDGLVTRIFYGDSLFLFVLIIGLYEMVTKPSWFKVAIRIFLVSIVIGTQFSGFIPIDQFYFGVYNTAWFSAVIISGLILIRIGKYTIRKVNKVND